MSSRYYTLSAYLRSKFGQRVQKIPLDGPFNCPNRDGTISLDGCAFCNPKGSGTGLWEKGLSLPEQYAHWQARFRKKYKAALFMIYLQSYTNTYGPVTKLQKILEELSSLPDCAGLCIGTRPDCLDLEKIKLIAGQEWEEKWLDIGLQSRHDNTLELINRGHTARDFAWACELAQRHGLKVCAHVIAGLPGENLDHFLETIRFLNQLQVQGVKIHNLYICRETRIADWFYAGKYEPLTFEEYISWTCEGLLHLNPDVVIHRLNGDPAPGELIGPRWAGRKQGIISEIRLRLQTRNVWQGQKIHPQKIPAWFKRQ